MGEFDLATWIQAQPFVKALCSCGANYTLRGAGAVAVSEAAVSEWHRHHLGVIPKPLQVLHTLTTERGNGA